MEKLKITVILCLGILSFGYYIFSGNMLEIIDRTDMAVIAWQHAGYSPSDSYWGMIFDYIIGFVFNVKFDNLSTYFKIFGG
jgi:hypothetical protein